ncbi:MAG: hypothetical protein K2N22_06205 [Clostridia bacterium]|nr:hypothetical protein [Clostridia bacterium]
MSKVNRKEKLYYTFIAIFLILTLFGIYSVCFQYSYFHILTDGREVEGTVVSYDVHYMTSPRRGGNQCVLYCEYRDEASGKKYKASTEYSKMRDKDYCASWCEERVGKSVQLIIDDKGNCLVARDKTWYVFRWILTAGLPLCAGAAGLTAFAVKYFVGKRRTAEPEKEDYLK